MPNARIEIEAVCNPNGESWHGEVEAAPPARRRVVNAKTFEDCIAQIVTLYNEIRPDGAPIQATPVIGNPAAPTVQGESTKVHWNAIGEATDWPQNQGHGTPPRRGRHPNACTCERCVAKKAA